MICASVPGERWEIEISKDGNVEFEIFKSDGNLYSGEYLVQKIEDFTD